MTTLTDHEFDKYKRLIDGLLKIGSVFSNYLTERQHNALRMYFIDRLSYSEIACDFGLSGERVKQIIEKGIRTIYTSSDKQSDYFYELTKNTKEVVPQLNAEILILKHKLYKLNKLAKNLYLITETTEGIDKNLDDLNLSVRAFNVLMANNVRTLKQMASLTESDLKKFRKMGTATIGEIKNKLKQYGYMLN